MDCARPRARRRAPRHAEPGSGRRWFSLCVQGADDLLGEARLLDCGNAFQDRFSGERVPEHKGARPLTGRYQPALLDQGECLVDMGALSAGAPQLIELEFGAHHRREPEHLVATRPQRGDLGHDKVRLDAVEFCPVDNQIGISVRLSDQLLHLLASGIGAQHRLGQGLRTVLIQRLDVVTPED